MRRLILLVCLFSLSLPVFAEIKLECPLKDIEPTREQLLKILYTHNEWLAYNENVTIEQRDYLSPLRANLCMANLSNVNLRDANLAYAKLQHTNLTGAVLESANLTKANLHTANLNKASLSDANLTKASLINANLSGADLIYADLNGADLIDADLTFARLDRAILANARLRNTNLHYASLDETNLSKTDLRYADLAGADLERANLAGAVLESANLTKANLHTANLNKANLTSANLTNAQLIDSDLTGADLRYADLTSAVLLKVNLADAIYEPLSRGIPNLDSLVGNQTLFTARYDNPRGFIALREAYDKSGLKVEAKKITRFLNQRSTSQLIHPCEGKYVTCEPTKTSIFNWIEWVFKKVFFEIPTDWGVEPGRSLKILLFGIVVFMFFYLVALQAPEADHGIWKVRAKERLRDRDKPEEDLISPTGFWQAVPTALYFSLLSAFHFGWRDLNVGSWIVRLQRKEYNYRATGWVRTVAGVQSLMSVYLVAMWVLTYFGRPFD